MAGTVISLAELKGLFLASADLREQSYDRARQRYRLDYHESAELACTLLNLDKEYAGLIGPALFGVWNDALDWAGDRTGRKAAVHIPLNFEYPERRPHFVTLPSAR